ncbi:hypothetical protein A1O1_09222 [Capronia coronata CBS 617.96]|uniref:ADF-H domain-containing protein n=1 Tax=Capronia coronata CBS 617.96 TaxID=1182541 RepID=W9XNB3_9EURO|nr:uncharacterized protein A1O1_09222 [Capronia coronata CBS 617.96]EXJ78820.1 hypothetical protein A1O1_09222 [Capronia coronata CBS 617.96]
MHCPDLASDRHCYLRFDPFAYANTSLADTCFYLDQIDPKTQEIKPSSDDTYSDILELADDLPDSSPRFVLLSYPLTLPSGRLSVPYVLIYYLPVNCNPNMRMSYAGAVELMRNTAEVNRVIEIQDADDLQEIETKLKGED